MYVITIALINLIPLIYFLLIQFKRQFSLRAKCLTILTLEKIVLRVSELTKLLLLLLSPLFIFPRLEMSWQLARIVEHLLEMLTRTWRGLTALR